MKQRRRANQSSANGQDPSHGSVDPPVTASSLPPINTAISTSTSASITAHSSAAQQRGSSSSSSLSSATSSSAIRSRQNTKRDDVKPRPKPTHSQTMLLELLLTVTRGSLIILTPLVAGMILRVAPSMLEPIYGSIFIEELFLEYSVASAGVGVVLAMIYTFALGSRRSLVPASRGPASGSATASSKAVPKSSTSSSSSLDIATIGLLKDEGLRKGVVISLDMCALFLASSFLTTHAMFQYSGDFGPWRGPHLTQLFLAYPVLALLAFANTLACVLRSYERERVHVRTWVSCALIHVVAVLGLTLVVFQMAPQGPNCPRVGTAAILVAAISGLHKLLVFIHGEVALPDERLESRSKPKTVLNRASLVMSFIPLIFVLALAAQNATRNPQCQAGVTKAHNPLNGNYTILARNESITGWISVADEHTTRNDLHIRIMRAGHSLIGGMYAESGDSIFGSFYIPEAVRLIKNREKNQQEIALQIGLGVGIASGSLTQLGVLVDVVEIDPVVADYASKYFDWPTPNNLYIQDGRQFIKSAPEGKYDYVIHDVFTGGGVPPSLFSLEALQDIQRIMRPDGVLALNMVGSETPVKAQALHSVRRTLHAAFKHVVAYKENAEDGDAYQNIVFFAAHIPIEFDLYEPPPFPTEEELKELQQRGGHIDHALRPSVMRDWILTSFPEWKLSTPYDPSLGELIMDRNNTLNGMQRHGAEDHWHAMRSLLPLDFWTNF
ncbi:hypothetical protein KVV02_006293 [Mortierella alpina]|uniref:PABS domain-containing protein n=1 Tax=Mortierella alpina TaxID=64518 RepID=A0A9P8A4K1_MORAP|nr:hypothetical protein KVV02_006293 [Mortierella alpina]